ncbi:MAG: hypothetical protein H0U49_00780 [Parachlamydiaceae bacterium]|nr:hypothetical protein [Parachlamydiaceae bacterium]
MYFALLELYWPNFTLKGDYVFLKENYKEERIVKIEEQNKNAEFWINLVTIDPYFENDEDGDKKAEAFTKVLIDMWEAKLKKEFPLLEFIIYYFEDEDLGDYGLTFYQKKYHHNIF